MFFDPIADLYRLLVHLTDRFVKPLGACATLALLSMVLNVCLASTPNRACAFRFSACIQVAQLTFFLAEWGAYRDIRLEYSNGDNRDRLAH